MMLVLLLLAVGVKAETVTVTYHIITLPYDNPETTPAVETYRVESVRCTATGDGTVTIGLPAAFKSPLATNYKYWSAAQMATKSSVKIHSPNNCTYTDYSANNFSATPAYTEGSSTVSANTDVYVTYDYDTDAAASLDILLDGSKEYNISLGNRILAYNFNRNDRPAALEAASVSADYLVSSESNGGYYYLWSFTGSDPYNIVIASNYSGTDSNKHDSQLFSRFGYSMWLTKPSKKLSNGDMQTGLYTSWVLVERNGGYAFMAANMAESSSKAPNNSGQYQYFQANGGTNPQALYTAESSVDVAVFYEVKTYTYKVKTPLSNTVLTATIKWSSHDGTVSVLSHIPDALRRKYATITGAYKEDSFTNPITTFADADANGGVIWLSYSSDMPFEALSAGGSYEDARWYTMRMNNENQYVVNYDAENNKFNTGLGSNSNLHQGENSAEAQVAFIGDPYELKIISRKASEDNSANRYIGCASAAADGTNLSIQTGSSDISSWEIAYDAVSGSMILRQLGTYASPMYIGWNYGASGNPVYYNTTGSRIKVVELGMKNYVYHIINGTGNVAVKMTEAQDVGQPLRLSSIPSLIRSPFLSLLNSSYISYYWSKADAAAGTNAKTHASYDPDTESYDVYVKYDSDAMATSLSASRVHFHTDQYFNVRLNGQYIYYNSGNINSQETITDDQAALPAYQWRLEGKDPYNMKVYNTGAEAYVKASFSNGGALAFDVIGNAASFVALSGTIENTFEVMAATGDDVDVADNYYHIGRSADNTVEMYDKATYPHGYTQIRFVLTLTDAKAYIYHLVDNNGTDLLQARSRFESLYFPIEYRSPLVSTYHYYATLANARNGSSEIDDLNDASDQDSDGLKDVYVTYDVNSRVNLQRGVLYLLKYQSGENFRQEDGGDGLLPEGDMAANTYRYKAVYPYCNGDCNFFVYGEEQYDIQQLGAASTRTRWAWFVESTNNDPYHVKICSRQTETFNSTENRGYFRTYVETFGDTKHVVTTLAWPGITGVQGTEYMVLGSVGQYQLVTTEPLPIDLNDDGDYDDTGESNERQVVRSFEQYWKTFDTIRKKIFGDNVSNNDIYVTDPTTVPATPLFDVTTAAGLSSNRTYLTTAEPTGKGWHNYSQWAYAKRWNGFNISGAKSKGWEEIEHWYQTVNMGEGYFDFVETNIDPVLILLDQHGWEIMRKPLPISDDDPDKTSKLEAIATYDSPMVKEYYFWTKGSKRSGFHQYYSLGQQIAVDGETYVASSLASLPPFSATNVYDAKGNLLDQYVTYVAKDEYAQSYTYDEESETWVGTKFLIQQGDKYFSASDASTVASTSVPSGGMSKAIIDAGGTFADNLLWYVKPNADIDTEMGYGGWPHDWDNVYTGKTDLSGFNSNGFDPYNIQISNAEHSTSFLVTDATTGGLDGDGGMVGDASTVSLGSKASASGSWHDSRALQMTNATFMAVQDDEGNMQLMPRFDHSKRVRNFASLVTPVAEAGDATKLTETHTLLFRPVVYNYHIMDNTKTEALSYRSGGDLVPQTPAHFKSPFAKDFTYYKEAECTNEITGSFASAGKTESTNDIYVRYAYDKEADAMGVLQGKWLTMIVNGYDVYYGTTMDAVFVYYDTSSSKPAEINASAKTWQWKFLETPQTEPDPYAVYLFSRNAKDTKLYSARRFSILNHPNGGYAFAAKNENYTTYRFLKGKTGDKYYATFDGESGFNSTSATITDQSKIILTDEVVHTYNYKVYTNGENGENAVTYGVLAISATQDQAVAESNEFVPVLPDAAQTPLLNLDKYLYYEAEADMGNSAKELKNLYGLYDDEVFVRYGEYDPQESTYMAPNEKALDGGHVARGTGSNDTPLSLSGNLLYNIVWYNDNMMKRNGSAIDYTANQEDLKAEAEYEWKLTGDDPYAIKITNMSDKNVYTSDDATCSLSDNATTFMLLNRDGYEYGVLAKTGDAAKMLSGYGNSIVDDSDPTKFIIFALSTYKVFYHLVIAKTCNNPESPGAGEYVDIPYYDTELATPVLTTKRIFGSSQRNLTAVNAGEGTHYAGEKYQLGETINGQTYSFDAGHVSLGDNLIVPSVFYRPNVVYSFFVEGVYNNEDCTDEHANSEMNTLYKGRELTQMGDNTGLLGKTVRINIVYSFDGNLSTNAGSGFVTTPDGTQWYTFDTNDPTPYLARYAYSDTRLTAKEGRATHYTNDYLWSPLGDPYGFKMYNRYVYKNGNETAHVMTTESAPAADDAVVMLADASDNSIYDLLESVTPGYFKVHPMLGADNLYLDNNEGVLTLKANSTTEWTYGLSESLLNPYYVAAGYVGGLTEAGKAAYEAVDASSKSAALKLMDKQAIVYNDDNIVGYTAGYYRLHSQPGASGISTVRYASGYTHDIEKTAGAGGTAIPMHFYETEGASTIFENLSSGGTLNKGFTETAATRGELPISAVEYDPASIFYFTGESPTINIQTQGLKVNGAAMHASTSTNFKIEDIGGACVVIHDASATPGSRLYLNYDQSDADHIYDLHFSTGELSDHSKWCMQPANKLGLNITTHSGGDADTYGTSYNYASTYLPFDILLPDDEQKAGEEHERIYQAFVLETVNSPWDPQNDDLHPKVIGKYNIAANNCPEEYRGSNKFVPAGTPVLLAMWDQTGYVRVTLPTSAPSTSAALVTGFQAEGDATTRNNILSGQYLEQKLSLSASERIYTFGLPFTGALSLDKSTGEITATLPLQDNSGLGFYLNANPDKELGGSRGNWTRNNWYVYNNKVYYRSSGEDASAKQNTNGIEFVPVVFDDGMNPGEEQEDNMTGRETAGDNRIYDLSGRCVATEAEVLDGTWRQRIAAGVYILNGRKFVKK